MNDIIDRPSKMLPEDWAHDAYPELSPPYKRAEGTDPVIDLGNDHKLHAQEYGNPNGEPVIVLHGGPGGGCDTIYARFFDPDRYRIIMFDQRGCGNSTPTTHTNLAAAMRGNNTAQLVEDINAVRKHFGINGKMHVEGGSWGSTLALAYAIKYPQNVKSLIMRGIFLGQENGIAYLFQGGAATYQEAPNKLTDDSTPEEAQAFLDHFMAQDATQEGAYRAYMGDGSAPGQIPEKFRANHSHMKLGYAKAWDEFVRVVPKEERGTMIAAYTRRLEAQADLEKKGTGIYDAATNTIDPDYQQRMAFAFAQWEGLISQFSQQVGDDGKIDLAKFADPDFALDFARLEARYSNDGFYLSEDGSPTPGGSNYIVENLDRIAEYKIPMLIAHGENDQVCPVRDAYLLEQKYNEALAEAGHTDPATVIMDVREKTGHSMVERGNAQALINLIKQAPRMSLAEKMGEPRSAIQHVKHKGDGLPNL